jgi:hypothetical protein
LIPSNALCGAFRGVLAHEHKACHCGTLLYHCPAAKDQAVHAPIAQAVPIGELNDRIGMRSHTPDITEQFVLAPAKLWTCAMRFA